MDELVQFLRARLAEDEQTAREAAGGSGPDWYYDNGHVQSRSHYGSVATGSQDFLESEFGAHIVCHDPARVLREVGAKRELLRVAAAAHDYHETFTSGFAAALEGTLRLFALAYADHPDYHAEWLP